MLNESKSINFKINNTFIDNFDNKNNKIKKMVDSQIDYIRRMSLFNDEQLKIILTQQLINHPHLIDNYNNEEQKKMLHDITKSSKDIKSNPVNIARKVI